MVDEPTEEQYHGPQTYASRGIEQIISERGIEVTKGGEPLVSIGDFDDLDVIDLSEAEGHEPVYRIERGWLVQDHGECTCNGPSCGVSSHEPGCGMEPLVYLEDLPGWPGAEPHEPEQT